MAFDYNNGKIKDSNESCENYIDKIINNYSIKLKQLELVRNNISKNSENLAKIKIENKKLSRKVLDSLNNTSSFTNKWIEFYPEFEQNYKLRPNITFIELNHLNRLRKIFDQSFVFLKDIDKLLKNELFMNKNFTELFKEIDDNLKKIDFYFENLKEDSLKFLSIVNIYLNINLKIYINKF